MYDGQRAARVSEFAEALRGLKERTPHSYETLATGMGVSRSTLHRYCAGKAVPAEFEPVRRLAEQAEASPQDVAELRRLWELATGHRTGEVEKPVVAEPAAEDPATADPEEDADGPQDGSPAVTRSAPPTDLAASDTDTPDEVPTDEAPTDEGSTDEGSTDGAAPADSRADAPPVRDPARGDPSAETVVSTPPDEGGRARGGRRRRGYVAAGALAAVLAGVLFAQSSGSDEDTDDAKLAKERLLLSAECEELISVGQEGTCVQELQTLLSKAGATIGVDSSFGPETTRRVLAFQLKAGLDVDGLVGDDTKRALYEATEPDKRAPDGESEKRASGAADVDLSSWDQERVRKKIREVFDEAADDAVKLAACQSQLDPLHIVPHEDESRSWGLFQFPDALLSKLGGGPEKALDPSWNITAAHKLWAKDRSFADLPKCPDGQ